MTKQDIQTLITSFSELAWSTENNDIVNACDDRIMQLQEELDGLNDDREVA